MHLAVHGILQIDCEQKTIHRKRAGNIKRQFFYLSSKASAEEYESEDFEEIILSELGNNGLMLQHFVKKMDKKLNGIKVFKSYVFDSLHDKKLICSTFTFFGLLTPRYWLTKKGKAYKEELIEEMKNSRLKDPVVKLISLNPDKRVGENSELVELPESLKDLKRMKTSDWNSAASASGLNPRGFLPI